MKPSQSPKIAFQPAASRSIQRGATQVVRAIRPTLGPHARVVAIDRRLSGEIPELVDGGSLVAQRITQLANPYEDIGAMLVRELAASVSDKAGDGTATAAVIFERILSEGTRYLAAGGDSVGLRAHLHHGAKLVAADLANKASPILGEKDLAHLANTLCQDQEMADMIGEVLDIVGEHGRVEVRPARHLRLQREYVEGMYWDRGVVARWMLEGVDQLKTEFTDASILVSDLTISEPLQLLPVVEAAVRTKIQALVLVVGSISDSALAFLKANVDPESLRCIVVRTPGWGKVEQAESLSDLAVLTGGRPLIADAGDSLRAMNMEDFGHARRVWANQKSFGIVGGAGDARQLRKHLGQLRTSLQASTSHLDQDRYHTRIGKLLGGSATLWVGGPTEVELEERLARAKRTIQATRSAMLNGVVPGGGVSLLESRDCLAQAGQAIADETGHGDDAAAAYQILDQALGEPFRTIVSNSGLDAAEAFARLDLTRAGSGIDVRTGEPVDMVTAGILDSVSVLQTALLGAVSSAALALSVEALVLRSSSGPSGPSGPAGHSVGKSS